MPDKTLKDVLGDRYDKMRAKMVGSTFFGILFESLSIDDLLVSIALMEDNAQRSIQDHARDLDFFLGKG